MTKRILVPLDGSAFSEAILPYAKQLARTLDAEIVLLHVIVEAVAEFETPRSPLAPQPVEVKKARLEAMEYIKRVCNHLEQEGYNSTYLIRDGGVAETIISAAEIMQAEMIVMSTHGRSGLSHMLAGSVAEQVVRRSPILVSLIRPRTLNIQT